MLLRTNLTRIIWISNSNPGPAQLPTPCLYLYELTTDCKKKKTIKPEESERLATVLRLESGNNGANDGKPGKGSAGRHHRSSTGGSSRGRSGRLRGCGSRGIRGGLREATAECASDRGGSWSAIFKPVQGRLTVMEEAMDDPAAAPDDDADETAPASVADWLPAPASADDAMEGMETETPMVAQSWRVRKQARQHEATPRLLSLSPRARARMNDAPAGRARCRQRRWARHSSSRSTARQC